MHWPIGNFVLRWWMKVHAAEVGDLFQHPKDYPPFVVWSALCTLKFTHEQAAALVRTVIRSSLRKRPLYKYLAEHGQALHEHLGYTRPRRRRDYTAKPVSIFDPPGSPPIAPTPTDIESDVYEHIVTRVLDDIREVRTDVLGFLYRAVENRLRDLRKQTEAAGRPALEPIPEQMDEEGNLMDEENVLGKKQRFKHHATFMRNPWREINVEEPEHERRARKRKESMTDVRLHDDRIPQTEIEAGERTADGLIDQARLTDRQRQVAELLLRGDSNAEIARELNISRPRITAILQSLRSNPPLQAAAKRLGMLSAAP